MAAHVAIVAPIVGYLSFAVDKPFHSFVRCVVVAVVGLVIAIIAVVIVVFAVPVAAVVAKWV